MFSRRLKTGYFVLEGLNSFATVYYFYYLYFFMQKTYGFGNKANMVLAALNGATYALMAWFGGRFAQRYGYFRALKVGYSIMIGSLSLGLLAHSAGGHIGVMVFTVVGMSFTWPTLEALVSEGEARAGLQHMVGVYNVVWAATAALGNFSGGAIVQKLGFASLFYVPIAIHVTQLSLVSWLKTKVTSPQMRRVGNVVSDQPSLPSAIEHSLKAVESRAQRDKLLGVSTHSANSNVSNEPVDSIPATNHPSLSNGVCVATIERARSDAGAMRVAADGHGNELELPVAKRFLRMAWLANPFAYIGINTLIAVIPGVASRLQLSTMAAGFCCSTWCFARLGAFALLWRWTGWHYRFRWLLFSFLGLVSSFGAVVMAPNIAVLVMAQLIFGGAVGLLYYSSLFYSMDRSDTKGEHGGIHEAVIGLGNCAGPAVGALAIQLVPQHSQSGTIAVITLLLCGLGGLIGIWSSKRQ